MAEINTWPGWECVRKIGEGSFGKVYEIQKIENGRVYKSALKVITVPQNDAEIENAFSEGMDKEAVTQYFKSFVDDLTNEFALMAELKGHTNIVSYEDHMIMKQRGKIGWVILIRMELLTPLLRWTTEHPMSEEDVINLGCDMCRALELCHKSKIIHRDIKPQNIFVNKNGDFKLGDFGIARVVEKTSTSLSQKGTYTYMAPEVYKGTKYDATVDIYSLGIVLYRYLNQNRTPFLPFGNINYRDHQRALERRMAGESILAPAMGSDRLKQIVLAALQYEPRRRVQNATALRQMLEQCRVERKASCDKVSKAQTVPGKQIKANTARIPDEDLETTIPIVPDMEIEATIPMMSNMKIGPDVKPENKQERVHSQIWQKHLAQLRRYTHPVWKEYYPPIPSQILANAIHHIARGRAKHTEVLAILDCAYDKRVLAAEGILVTQNYIFIRLDEDKITQQAKTAMIPYRELKRIWAEQKKGFLLSKEILHWETKRGEVGSYETYNGKLIDFDQLINVLQKYYI